ncbi:MAG: sulfide/dihydroorotate dehydrogenase-like FAD/NAD-binding protein [Candidatus Bathyarchaeia archaeon]
MYKILNIKELAPKIKWFEVYASHIAKKAKPGQFIMLIINESGERIPLTIAGYDREKGTISFAVNEVGKTTKQLGLLKEGDYIYNITGPLGNPSEIRKFGKVLCVAAGIMIAPMLLQIKALREAENEITAVIGARRKDLIFFKEEIKALSHRLYVATDDGSEGYKGLDFLKEIVVDEKFDRCIVMGPVPTLRAVSEITRPYKIPTIVSLMPLMVDGMGMCGACRVFVGGKMKFACVDGPEFDGHLVDYEELIRRQRMFLSEERLSALLWELGGLKYG